MNIQKELLSDHQVKLTVSIPPEPLEEAKRRAARQIAKKVKIPGFRPGKAPYAVVLRSVGESAIFQEAVELLADETYPKVLDEAEIKPWGPGSLKDIPAQDPLTFEFVVPLQPEVTLSDYRALRFPYELKATTEEEVEQAIEDLRDRHATYETIMDRPAREGDQVSIRIKAERKTVAENQSLALINERDSELTINAESDDTSKEWPFSGFSRRLVGLNPGDEINFDYTYPEDSTLENLRGVEAVFYVQVVAIKLRTLPEVNEEFLKSLGEFKDVDEFRGIVRQNLERQAKALYDRDYGNQIINAMLADAQIKYPPQMFEQQMESSLHRLEGRLSQNKLDMATYLKARRMDEAALREELRPEVETSLKRSLLLLEVSRVEKIQVSENELQYAAMQNLNELSRIVPPEEARRVMTKDFVANMMQNVSVDLLMDHTMERLRSIGRGENPPIELTETSVVAGEETSADESVSAEAETKPVPATDAPNVETEPEPTATPEEASALAEPASNQETEQSPSAVQDNTQPENV